ncbi:MAG: hypothetical protein IJC26_02575, partial [Clostridia bacterium]|nr:hypothetical protein [Clostridia bacterium]
LDQSKKISVFSQKKTSLRFLPKENGFYHFTFQFDDSLNVDVYDENGNLLSSSGGHDLFLQENMTAGVVYYLIISANEPVENGSCTILASKPVAPTSLKFTQGESCADYVGSSVYLSYSFGPAGCYSENVTFTSDDPSVVLADPYSPWIELLAPGTAKVTVTSESGLTDSITVTGLEIPTLTFNTETTVDLISTCTSDQMAMLSFTPEKDAFYCFRFSGARGITYQCQEEDFYGDVLYDSEVANVELEEGVTYHFSFYSTEHKIDSFALKVTEASELKTMELVSLPKYMDYFEGGGEFDYYGLALKGTLADGTEVSWIYDYNDRLLGGYSVSVDDCYDQNGCYEKTIVTCGEKSIEFSFRVTENPVDHLELVQGTIVSCIEHHNGIWNGKNFIYNFDTPTDARIKICYKDGSHKIASVSDTPDLHYSISIDGRQHTKPWSVGVNHIVISYLGHEVLLPITVHPSPVESIQYLGEPIQLYENANGYVAPEGYFSYFLNFLADETVRINKKDGSSEICSIINENGYYEFEIESDQYANPWRLGQTGYVEICYHGLSCSIPVIIVENPVDRIELLSAPTATYDYGDLSCGWFDDTDYYLENVTKLDGLSFRIHYSDGTHEDVSHTDLKNNAYKNGFIQARPLEAGPHTVGQITVQLDYLGKTLTYNAALVPSPVSSLEVVEIPERAIESGWTWPDLRGTRIKIHYTNGTDQTVTFTKENAVVGTFYEDYLSIEVGDSRMAIFYDFESEKWLASFMGVQVVLNVPFAEEPNPSSLDLIHFEPEIKGTRLLATYDSKTEEITLGEAYPYYTSAEYSNGFVETSDGLVWFDLSYYPDERGYALLQIFNNSFFIPLGESQDLLPGDVDGSGEVDMDDAIYLLFHCSFAEEYPIEGDADFDNSGEVDMDDAIYLLFYCSFPDEYPLF